MSDEQAFDWRSEAIKAFRDTIEVLPAERFKPAYLAGVRMGEWLCLSSMPTDPEDTLRIGHISGRQVLLTYADVLRPYD